MASTFNVPKRPLTWLITGCSSGFGLTLTRIAQADGHTVIATSRDPSRTPDLVAEVEGNGGKWLQLDVTSATSAALVEQLEAAGTQIDVLVNNAGFSIYAPVETVSEEEVRAQMEAMYFGPLRLIRAVLPHMRERRYGVIVNFSSGASLEGNPTMGPYSGAKAGLDAVTRVLAKEVAPFNIRTLTAVLGTFDTNMLNKVQLGKAALPSDYNETIVEKVITALSNKSLQPNGSKEKAMKALYEVIVAEGEAGTGKEAEKFLPLGTDMTARVKVVQQYLQHSLDVFGFVTNNVGLDK
ncbi:putative short-chain oxidoreductase [Xylariales sp. PMI_506]|nr:putative short-chain oxidoreductase [Xylariales sp. PMI_506]